MSKLSDLIVNGLAQVDAGKILDARQGTALKLLIDSTVKNGTSVLFVNSLGTPTQNAATLQAAYDLAKTMTPDGAALSATNRVRLVVAPGKYTFGGTKFPVDTQFIDIVSIDGNKSVIMDGINVTASDVYLKGIDCGTDAFNVATSLPLLICENCKGGQGSFGGYSLTPITVSGTFINCTAGKFSFGSGTGGSSSGTFSGTAINCTAVDYSFGQGYGGGIFSGIAINCTSGGRSYGHGDADAATSTFSGTATNCTSINGTTGSYSFGGGRHNTFSGTATNCIAGAASFGDGDNFGDDAFEATGRLYYCRKTTDGAFTVPVAGGRQILCIDGNNNVVTI